MIIRLNHLTLSFQVSGTEDTIDPISQVVESLHMDKVDFEDFAKSAVSTTAEDRPCEMVPGAFAQPSAVSGKDGQPYVIQEFKMNLSGIEGQNGRRTPFFKDMTVFLPVYKRVQEPVDILKVSLKPIAGKSSEIISI